MCALMYIYIYIYITPKTPALAFSVHSIVHSVPEYHEKESPVVIYSRILDGKRNLILCTRIIRTRPLFLDDDPCVKLRRGESFFILKGGATSLSRFPLLLSLRLSTSS